MHPARIWSEVRHRLRAVFRRAAVQRELDDEISMHIELETENLMRSGLARDEAARQARLVFGGTDRIAEATRDAVTGRFVEKLGADVRFGFRHFCRTPLSTITMVLVLSLGIGANIALFTLLNSLATMPAPGIARDDDVVRIRGAMTRSGPAPGPRSRSLSYLEVQEYSGRSDLFAEVAAYTWDDVVVEAGEAGSGAFSALATYVTPNYFRLLDVRPVLGSDLPAEPNVSRPVTPPGAIISHSLWQERFGGAPDVLGRTLRVNNVPVSVVGVAPPLFHGTFGSSRHAVWLPLAYYPQVAKTGATVFASYDSTFLRAIARLRDNVSVERASPVVQGIGQRSHAARTVRPEDLANPNSLRASIAGAVGTADIAPLLATNESVRPSSSEALTLAAAGGALTLLILLITCTNVSSLMVGLAVARRREIAVRLSLGASRARVIRQLLTETTMLALFAAAVAVTVIVILIRIFETQMTDVQLAVDWRVVISSAGFAILTGMVFGLSPALHATRLSVADVLKNSAAAVSSRSFLQRGLVVAQVTLTQPLLLALGVVILSIVSDLRGSSSPYADQILEIELEIYSGGLSTEQRRSAVRDIATRLSEMPGVRNAILTESGSSFADLRVHPGDRAVGVMYEPSMTVRFAPAPPGYFDMLDINVVRGREFDSADETSAIAIIVSADLARRLWGEADPLGRRLVAARELQPDSGAFVVVGVVADVGPGASVAGSVPRDNEKVRVYVPFVRMAGGLIVRTEGPAEPMIRAMRSVVMAAAPQIPIRSAETVAERENRNRRVMLRASGGVAAGGVIALLLSAIGLYAVVSFAVGQRIREIGIRTALGARSDQVVRLFFLKGLALCMLGLILGLPLSIFTQRVIISTLDIPLVRSPAIGALNALLILAVASLAVWIPARRAAGVDPLVALRSE